MKAFEDEPRQHAVVGEKFIVAVGNDVFSTGDIITLSDNDNSCCPLFKNKNNHCHYFLWENVAPYVGEVSNILDTQIGGDHYKKMGEYQPWQVFEKWMSSEELKGFMKGTAIGYLSREQDKGGRQDIEKAMHTIQLYLQLTKEK